MEGVVIRNTVSNRPVYEIDQDLSDRIKILKVWLIIMVVFIHSNTEGVNFIGGTIVLSTPIWLRMIKYVCSESISRCAIPLFFIISSFLLYSKQFTWKSNLRKKVRTILIPYFFWNSLWLLLFYFAQSIRSLKLFFPNQQKYICNFSLLQWLDAYLGIYHASPFLYTFWFLRDLFILNVLAIIIKKIIDSIPHIALVAIAVLWLGNFTIPFINVQSVVFFSLGYYIVKFRAKINSLDKLNWAVVSLGYLCMLIMDCLYHKSVPITHQIEVIIGMLFFIKASKLILLHNEKNIIIWLSQFTFIIYAFHEMNLTILKKIMVKFLPQYGSVQLAEYFGIPCIIITLCILFGAVLKRFSPKFYKTVTGSR